jgi:hypothetical protein
LPAPIPADWEAEPCLDLVNSRFADHLGSGEVHDRLPQPEFRRAFLTRWHYKVEDPNDPKAVARLRRLRQVIRLSSAASQPAIFRTG